jgi:dUTP pyrophosphatase
MELQEIYDQIELPSRATDGSCGYDFVTPIRFTLAPGTKVAVPTGIRVVFEKEEWGLFMMPKSRNVKTSIRLANTIGVIDNDYSKSDNEGHIIIFLEMPFVDQSSQHLQVYRSIIDKNCEYYTYNAGDEIVQGVFLEFGLVSNDNEEDKDDRNGGFGSTTTDGEGSDESSESGTDSNNGDDNTNTDKSEETDNTDSEENPSTDDNKDNEVVGYEPMYTKSDAEASTPSATSEDGEESNDDSVSEDSSDNESSELSDSDTPDGDDDSQSSESDSEENDSEDTNEPTDESDDGEPVG